MERGCSPVSHDQLVRVHRRLRHAAGPPCCAGVAACRWSQLCSSAAADGCWPPSPAHGRTAPYSGGCCGPLSRLSCVGATPGAVIDQDRGCERCVRLCAVSLLCFWRGVRLSLLSAPRSWTGHPTRSADNSECVGSIKAARRLTCTQRCSHTPAIDLHDTTHCRCTGAALRTWVVQAADNQRRHKTAKELALMRQGRLLAAVAAEWRRWTATRRRLRDAADLVRLFKSGVRVCLCISAVPG